MSDLTEPVHLVDGVNPWQAVGAGFAEALRLVPPDHPDRAYFVRGYRAACHLTGAPALTVVGS